MLEEMKKYVKFKDNKEYNKFLEDFSKYKKALYSFYENNNEKFPMDEFSHKDDLILIIFLNEYEYSHEIVLNVLDNILIPRLNLIELYSFLNFLYGFGVLNKDEMNDRNIVTKILDKNLNIFS